MNNKKIVPREWEIKVLLAKAFDMYDASDNSISHSPDRIQKLSDNEIGLKIDRLAEILELKCQAECLKYSNETLKNSLNYK